MPHASRILLFGPPGTGKTSIGFSDGSEPYYFPCHDESSVAELLGHFIPVGNRFIWLNGPGLAAATEGRRLIIDEIDQASGSVLSVLRALLNDPGVARFTIPDPALASLSDEELGMAIVAGEGLKTISPADGFQVIATMNGEPEDLDEPLLDRFEAVLNIESPNPAAIAALPEDLQQAAKGTASDKNPDRRIGLRRWKAFANLRENVGEDTAGRAVFGPRYGDVTDALKLSRGTAPKTPRGEIVDSEELVQRDAEEMLSDGAFDARGNVAAAVAARIPTAYYLKTGKRGRPPRAACPTHGYMTQKRGVEGEDGLTCKSCGYVAAERGQYIARIMDPITREWRNR
jgi:hypothetical protein